jgi:hypothetical protein
VWLCKVAERQMLRPSFVPPPQIRQLRRVDAISADIAKLDNAYLASVLGNAAAAGKTDTFLGQKYRRIARRRGSKRAIVALGRSILVIAWHLLSDPETRLYEALGYTVTLKPAA